MRILWKKSGVAPKRRQLEAFGGNADVGAADHRHDDGGQERDDVEFVLSGEPYGDGPQGDHGERLVDPSEIAPEDVEIDKHEQEDDGKDDAHNDGIDVKVAAQARAYAADDFVVRSAHEAFIRLVFHEATIVLCLQKYIFCAIWQC